MPAEPWEILHVREASLEAKAMQQSRAGFGSGWFVVHGGERSIWSRQYACSGYAVAQRRSGTRNCAPRGGNFRRHLGDIPCLRQGNPSRPAARLRLWWWLLRVRAGALVRVRERCLSPSAPCDEAGAQAGSETAIKGRCCLAARPALTRSPGFDFLGSGLGDQRLGVQQVSGGTVRIRTGAEGN
jgi:hypothetical protein